MKISTCLIGLYFHRKEVTGSKYQSKTSLSTGQISDLQRELQNDIPNVEARSWLGKLYLGPAEGPDHSQFSWRIAAGCLHTLQALTHPNSQPKKNSQCVERAIYSLRAQMRFWDIVSRRRELRVSSPPATTIASRDKHETPLYSCRTCPFARLNRPGFTSLVQPRYPRKKIKQGKVLLCRT